MRLLTAFALVAALATAAGLAWGSRPAPPAPPGLALPALAPSLPVVDRMILARGGQTLVLERRGNVWVLAQHGGYPADSGRASALLQALGGMRLMRQAPGVMESLGLADPGQPGSPAALVKLLTLAGKSAGGIVLGGRDGDGQYVRRPGDYQAWVADRAIDADPSLAGWTDTVILPFDPATVTSAVVRRGVGAEAPAGALVAALAAARFVDVHPASQVATQPVGEMRLTLTDGTAVTVGLGTAAGLLWVRLIAAGPGAEAINCRSALWAYALPPDAATALLGEPP